MNSTETVDFSTRVTITNQGTLIMRDLQVHFVVMFVVVIVVVVVVVILIN